MNASATPDAGVTDRLSIAHTGWRRQQGGVEGGSGGGVAGAGAIILAQITDIAYPVRMRHKDYRRPR